MNQPVYPVDIMKQIVASMRVTGISGLTESNINFQAGSGIQIVKTLDDLDTSITSKGLKYPLIAIVLPITERRGRSVGFYAKATFPKIVIATISQSETDDVLLRYADDGVFKTVLYPCYYEFLYQCGVSSNVNGEEPSMFEHSKKDCPGIRRIASGTNDFVDYIEILNLELTLLQIKTC